jgi:alanyl-tRNA synthetase
VRAGGKHNDLENVGYTARHHTFFEMLGNFSFGDYFKREAIRFAWEFLTVEMKLDPKRLWITVFEEDDEAADIWLKEIGVHAGRFARIGAHDNFWSMGETGPCGPCSEIFYDHGPEIAGGPPGTAKADGDRYVEIWNLVFMQYNRATDGTQTPLPKPSVDTGMGLERLAAIMQGVHSNYDIDLFRNLIVAAADLIGTKDLQNNSLKVIADHIRSCSFLIADGVKPSNERRGYVLRRIIRRAIRHGDRLGVSGLFFYRLVDALVKEMGQAYPELVTAKSRIESVLLEEEERFAVTLRQGLDIFEQAVKNLEGSVIPGEIVFKLHDTYGFPPDLTADIARERNLRVDMTSFEHEMDAQRERARAASTFKMVEMGNIPLGVATDFIGYDRLVGQGRITALTSGETLAAIDELEEGKQGTVVLDVTPFYAESGGQVGDCGLIETDHARFEVRDTRKLSGDTFAHFGTLIKGNLHVGDVVTARVDQSARRATAKNHSATHLVHAALRKVLGDHVTQKGSLVEAARLRFDFSHFEAVTADQLHRIEELVNEQVQLNVPVETNVMPVKDAMASGAMAFFGEKYGDEVRVLRMGDFSSELCGGTHVSRTGDIGLFKIISEGGVAAGVRRIEAITGQRALEWIRTEEVRLNDVTHLVKGDRDNVVDKVRQLVERQRQLEKELEQLKGKLASRAGGDLADQALNINGVQVVAARLEGMDARALRDTVDQLKNKLGSAAIVLACVDNNKVLLVAGVTKGHTKIIPAGELVNVVAQKVGGKGGGRPDMAQAGGDNPAALDSALAAVPDWIRERVS